MQVIVDGLATNYFDVGESKKPAILCVHGWGDSSDTFKELAGKLSKTHRVVAVDLPGFGQTDLPGKTWHLDDFALFIHHFLLKLKLKPEAIIGHSNGGAIAIKTVASGLERPKKLILIASSGIRRPYAFRNTALKVLAKSGKLVLHLAPPKSRDQLKRKLYRRIGSDYMVNTGMKETFKNIVAEDVLDIASLIKIPTTLIYGDEDHATPQLYGALFADAIPNAELHVIEEVGHFVHQEDLGETAKIITGALKK